MSILSSPEPSPTNKSASLSMRTSPRAVRVPYVVVFCLKLIALEVKSITVVRDLAVFAVELSPNSKYIFAAVLSTEHSILPDDPEISGTPDLWLNVRFALP